MVETLYTMSLQGTSLTIIFKTNLYSVLIHLYKSIQIKSIIPEKMTALIHHIVSRPWSFTVCSLVA